MPCFKCDVFAHIFNILFLQVHGFPKAKFKGFPSLQEAQNFLGIFESASGSPAAAKRPLQEETEAPEQKRPAAKRPRVQQSPQAANVSSNWQVFIGFDGGARGNPGIAGAGAEVVIAERTPKNVQKHRRKIHLRTFVGNEGTCNQAEWQGALSGLKELVKQVEIFNKINDPIKPQIELFVQGDSQLVIRQLDGTYEVRNPGLEKLKQEFDAALGKLKELTNNALLISYEHVYRVDNKVADGTFNLFISCLCIFNYAFFLKNLHSLIKV